jgi:branched-chain amino acid transport system substrate-binding protein
MLQRRACVLLSLAALLLFACQPTPQDVKCTDEIGCVEIAPGEPIRIASFQALSGTMAADGKSNHLTTELALADRGGQLLGHRISLQSEDSQCTREGGATAASKAVVDPKIVGIVGPTCSGSAAGAMKVVSEAGLVMVSGSSTAPSLTSVGGNPGADWQPGFLRTAQNDALSGRVAAIFAFEHLAVSRAATINDGDPYTLGLTDTFEQEFTKLGGEIVLTTAVNKGDTNMQPVLTAVVRSGAELLFFPVFRPEGDYIVLQAEEMDGLEQVSLMNAEGLFQEGFIASVGQAGVGVHLVIPTTPESPALDAFVSKYEAESGEAPTSVYFPHMYDAVSILLDALETVAVQKEDGTLYIGRQALRDALYATSGYQGLSGRLACDRYGDCGGAAFEVLRLDDPAAGLEGLAANTVYSYPSDP